MFNDHIFEVTAFIKHIAHFYRPFRGVIINENRQSYIFKWHIMETLYLPLSPIISRILLFYLIVQKYLRCSKVTLSDCGQG